MWGCASKWNRSPALERAVVVEGAASPAQQEGRVSPRTPVDLQPRADIGHSPLIRQSYKGTSVPIPLSKAHCSK